MVPARAVALPPTYDEVIEFTELNGVRTARSETSAARYGPLHKGVAYTGYAKSAYAQDWFDSSPEREVANLLEDTAEIACWVRLQIGDVPILWRELKEYNPDFVAIETGEDHWLIEAKMDKEMASEDVQGKRAAALRWANHVNEEVADGVRWGYLLVSETDIRTARGSWPALKRLGSAAP